MFRLSKIFGRRADIAQPRSIKSITSDIKRLGKYRRIVFLNSMADTFHESFSDELITSWLDMLVSTHVWIILTKRVNRMYTYFKNRHIPDNFWLGTSIESRSAYHRLEKLKHVPAKIKFVSLEPLLESVADIDLQGIQWCIVGGESDQYNPRPFDEQWAREIRDICKNYNIPFFYKQSGGRKKINGTWGTNILDVKTYLELPEALKTKPSEIHNIPIQ